MAVQEQTPQIEYVANGVTKSFPLTFDCEDQDHLIVTVNDAELSVGSWMLIDENVSFKVAPTNGSNIVIQRNTPMQRTTTYKTYNNSFRPEPVNKDLDRIWWKLQELGLADWLLSKRLDREIQDRIAADIYYYTLITKETDLKLNQLKSYIDKLINDANNKTDDLKKYIDALVNNITGNNFLPISDRFIDTWNGRVQRDKNLDVFHIKDFGAVGDGISNDTDAIMAAISANVSLDWGDSSCVYRVRGISYKATSDIHWIFRGAQVVSDGLIKANTLYLDLDGFDLNISKLDIDARRTSFTGLRIDNLNTIPSNITLINPKISHCYRSSLKFNGGDGISITGNFDNVFIMLPRIRDIAMATGAGIPGSQGVSGLSIVRSSVIVDAIPRNVMVIDPYINEVYSEDLNYTMDQDGIRVFTKHSQPEFTPKETAVTLTGGTYRNCLGRSIKSQSELLTLTDPKFIRTRGFNRGYGNHEIDCQVGGGYIRGLDGIYSGTRPDSLVFMNSSSSIEKNGGVGLCKVSDLRVAWNAPSAVSNWLVLLQVGLRTLAVNPSVNISDVEVRSTGTIGRIVSVSGTTLSNKDTLTLSMRDVQAPVRDSAVYCAGDVTITGKLDSIRNTRNQVAHAALGTYIGKCTLDCVNMQNFLESPVDGTSTPYNAIPIVGTLKPKGSRYGGVVRFLRERLSAEVGTRIPLIGFERGNHILIISISHSRSSSGIFAVGNTGVTLLSGDIKTISTGTTSPPEGEEPFKIWVDGEDLIVYNNTKNQRYAVIQQMG